MLSTQQTDRTKTFPAGSPSRDNASGAAEISRANRLWQALALNPITLQPKLTVSQFDDPAEREADRVADRIMRMPLQSIELQAPFSSVAPVRAQRKCAGCEEEDEEERNLQRKEHCGGDSLSCRSTGLDQVLNQAGQPLDHSTRNFFEPRLGQTLSDVRVHAGAAADTSARNVNALAFTVGRHIAFRDGHYAPHTQTGQHLLAHELVHVIQQRGAGAWNVHNSSAEPRNKFAGAGPATSTIAGLRLQRTGPAPTTAAGSDFDIVGKSENTKATLIHFDRNSDVIDSDEEKKLTPFATDDVNLNAHQSEDEPAGTSAKRGAAVKKAFVDAGHDAAKLHVIDRGVEAQIEYRDARIVEIVKVGTTPLKSHCPANPKLKDLAVACTNVGRSAPFRAGLAAARAAIKTSRELLKKDTAKGTPSATTLDVVKSKFAKPSNSDKVRDKLGEIDNFLKNLPAITECHNECDPDCSGGGYWEPNRSKMVLCPSFTGLSSQGQAGLIMHEATHGVPTIQSEDLGYASDRMINFLDETHAFKNTDSYTTLVRELSGVTNFTDKVPSDVITGFTTRTIGGVVVTEQDLVQKAEALAEKWCIWAQQDLEFVYGGIRKAIDANTTLTSTGHKEVMTSLHNHFALTDVASKPTLADETAVAALRDKFVRFGIDTFNQALAVKSVSGTDTAWGASKPVIPGGKSVVPPNLDIGDDFWAATDDVERAKLLVAALARATKDATAAMAPAYGKFAFDRSQTPERL